VALVHKKNKLKKSLIYLYVNGELKRNSDCHDADDGGTILSYPVITPPISRCRCVRGSKWNVYGRGPVT
jgi:hypothetical protein